MPIAAINSIRTLAPGQHGIHLQVKMLERLVMVETVKNGVSIQVSEYLVGDKSGCIMLKTPAKGTVYIKG
ncbi:hypothetical protein BCR42DRAFT_201243 [Absidia repens]|uniref:Uncharacterized protein n=1 Tax=Absidia repens TaxID=90262 RepID=A0A1X2HRC1_9FUNG|nr:hypothetical protein BCR42DRAFT_201243 [Absidia repens]